MNERGDVRIALHSAVLGFANLVAILAGFAIHRFVKSANQIMVQAPVAAALSVAFFAAWLVVSSGIAPRAFRLRGAGDGFRVWGLAPAWAALAFVPMHFFSQGYLTSFGNIAALWAFQLPVNAVAVGAGMAAARSRAGMPERRAATRDGDVDSGGGARAGRERGDAHPAERARRRCDE